MVDPADVPRILLDAARLMRSGELGVFGSAALAFWLDDAPRTRDVDVWCVPAERGDVLEALMGELSWYQERHDAYLEVWSPETFAAPRDWRGRGRAFHDDTVPDVTLVVPHPHDVLLAKVERWSPSDQTHAALILDRYPLSASRLADLVRNTPCGSGRVDDPERCARFARHLEALHADVLGRDQAS